VSSECREVCRKLREDEKRMDTQQSWGLVIEGQFFYSSSLRHSSSAQITKRFVSFYIVYQYITILSQASSQQSKVPQQQQFQKIASTIPLPTAEPLQGQCQLVSKDIGACGSTDLLQNLRHQQRKLRAVWMIVNNKIGSIPDLRHVQLGQGHHQSDSASPAQVALAGQ
jgi:hypothetical protein